MAHKAETLLSALKVMSRPAERRSLPALRVSLPPLFRGEAVIQPVEVAAVDLAAVDKTEQAVGVEPHSVRLFSRRVILVGMAERALALQVVRGRRRLGECRYHDELRKAGGMTAATEPSAAFRPGAGTASMTTGAEILISVRSLPGFPKQIVPR